jgi:hypothetical protein
VRGLPVSQLKPLAQLSLSEPCTRDAARFVARSCAEAERVVMPAHSVSLAWPSWSLAVMQVPQLEATTPRQEVQTLRPLVLPKA